MLSSMISLCKRRTRESQILISDASRIKSRVRGRESRSSHIGPGNAATNGAPGVAYEAIGSGGKVSCLLSRALRVNVRM